MSISYFQQHYAFALALCWPMLCQYTLMVFMYLTRNRTAAISDPHSPAFPWAVSSLMMGAIGVITSIMHGFLA